MQELKIKLILLGFLGLLQTASLSAQNQLNSSIGIGSVRGDFLSDYLAIEGIGPHVQTSYLFEAKNNHFLFGPTASFTQNTQSRVTSYDSLPRTTSMNIQHYFIGVELKTYLASSAWLYNPYPGRVLPYLNVAAGTSFSNNTLSGFPPPADFTVKEGLTVSVAINLELGLELNLNEKVSMKGSFTVRGGANDFWDGLAGTGVAPDLLAATHIGIVYRFTQKQVF